MINLIVQGFFKIFLDFRFVIKSEKDMKALSQFRQIMVTSPAKSSLRNDSIVIKTVDYNQEQTLNQLSTLVVDEELAKHLTASMKLNVVLLQY